jgi:membrane protease YdiL (CAAX protease family)
MKLTGETRRHPAAALMVGALGVAILVNAAIQGDLGRALLYFGAIGAGLVAIEVVLARWPVRAPVPVVRGAGLELGVLTASFAVGLFWLYGRFVRDYRPAPGPGRIIWLLLLAGCVFNALPALFLLVRRYRLRDLGLAVSGVPAAALVIAIFALASLATPTSITWKAIVEDSGGSATGVLSMALLAAVPEEFFRFVWQTRAGAVLANRATGWMVASVAWAMLHGPKDWNESHSLAATVMGVLNIVPLGLLWGYLTHRTRSMVSSILLHATNVWGLQNLT